MALIAEDDLRPGYADCHDVPGQGREGRQVAETAAHQHGEWERILQKWNQLDPPEGELVVQVTLEGTLMSPPAGPRHRDTVDEMNKILLAALGNEYRIHQTSGMAVPSVPGIFVPDFLVVPKGRAPSAVPSEKAILVVEVTSPSNAKNDRETKYQAYAKGGVPQYLLIDPVPEDAQTVTLFTDPSGGEYTRSVQVPYGESITVNRPVPIVIDTSLFPRTDED